MYQKIGTGITNVNVNKGGTGGTVQDTIISGERDRLLKVYEQVIKKIFNFVAVSLKQLENIGKL